jgi:glycosyltransferase involved in cell wall biosynthesis
MPASADAKASSSNDRFPREDIELSLRIKAKTGKRIVFNPSISVIIPCYSVDRFNDILELVDSIQSQTYPNVEVIFVSDSLELYNKLSTYLIKKGYAGILLLLNEGERGAASARNVGIKHAKGDILAFVDDDVVLFPDWAEEMVKTFVGDNSIIGVTGSAFPLWEDELMDWFPEEFFWIISCTSWANWSHMGEVRNVTLNNLAFRREAFNLCGLFRGTLGIRGDFRACWNILGSEENELALRVKRITGKRIIYNVKVRVRHRVPKNRLTLDYVAKRSYHVGRNRVMLKKLYPEERKGIILSDVEYALLRRIFGTLFVDIFRLLFSEPLRAWRKLKVTIVSLFFSALGYCYQGLKPIDAKIMTPNQL